ncbi:hypothetical protein J7T55_009587 [Diaporthe amygdali]|uniref:uncharacterized protein n=1 Tax=Phomopsis amygdali TaxID=1214568 RepID=UPI0022FEFD93|nr:uncharacterized protein J7T55_009587 [Diaporthe amygdali]KAJ0109256.1 hypothetical protein J7T55_009587 [Diaporthe amygdali]
MARSKQAMPVQRATSSEYISKHDRFPKDTADVAARAKTGIAKVVAAAPREDSGSGMFQLLICVGGIYASFISWAWLQEGVTTTPYTNNDGSTEMWKFPVFLLTVQSILSSITGSLYLWWSTPRGQPVPPIIPTNRMLPALILVAFTQALAAPFGMASLAHVNYITFTLAKSCKLLPVMFLHVTLFRRRYPLQKYLIVAAVTAGVAVFTLHSGSKKHKSGGAGPTHSGQTAWGMLLLSINLLFDGLTNSTQDYIVSEFKPYRGPQMMCANNMMSSALSGAYLLLSPYLVRTALGEWFGMADVAGGGELYAALGFLARHPGAWWHVLGFGLCGAVGQVFIFYTVANFGSVTLVTVTVTRKMLTMILSVVYYGHSLNHKQWMGVALVFGGIGFEAYLKRSAESKKAAERAAKAREEKAQ